MKSIIKVEIPVTYFPLADTKDATNPAKNIPRLCAEIRTQNTPSGISLKYCMSSLPSRIAVFCSILT